MDSKGPFTRTEGKDGSDINKNGLMVASINYWQSKVMNVKHLRKAFQQEPNHTLGNCAS